MLVIKRAPEVFQFREGFDVFIVKIDWRESAWNECWSVANWFGTFWNPLLYLRKIGILLCFLRKLSTWKGDWVVIMAKINIITLRPPRQQTVFEGILPKGPYLPYASMAGRALLAGYHRILKCIFLNKNCPSIHLSTVCAITKKLLFRNILFLDARYIGTYMDA